MYIKNYSFIKSVFYLNDKYNLNLFNNNLLIYKNYKNYCIEYNKFNILKNKIENINFILNCFFNFNLNKKYKKYLIKVRKIPEKLISKFEIGYCDNDNKKIFNYFNIYNINKKNIINNNILFNNKNKLINLFNNSYTFPIHGKKGIILGFGARKLSGNIKYLNSYENIIFKKKNILYGLFFTHKYIEKYNYCFLTEGYIDLISLYKINIKNVVSTLGINISQEQINILKKITKNIIILYDGDNAGILATKNIINILFKNNFNVKIILLKKNYDIDDYIIKKQKQKYKDKDIKKKILKKCINIFEFYSKIYNYKKNNIYNKYIIMKILYCINNINNYILKYLYIKKMAKFFKFNKNILLIQLFYLNKKKYFKKKNFNIIYNNIYIDFINYKYNFIKKFYKIKLLNNNKIKINNTFFLKKKNYNLEKNIIIFILKYNILNFIYKKKQKSFKYIKKFFSTKKILFFNKKFKKIYNNIILKNKKYIINDKKLYKFILKYINFNKFSKYKNIKNICYIMYYKYKIFINKLKLKKIKTYNKKKIKKIINIIKKNNIYKNKINLFYTLCK
ncbi:MAG: toprim domain-containing protein [Candidatus Shikimatogenerans sp. Tser]|uniref:Toprim domain-containing protein n=1 Tax=Candidatus Shikimatogenerans sp. Tser TaxID=3158568 RepID=A0AAU7QR39_9FLAO